MIETTTILLQVSVLIATSAACSGLNVALLSLSLADLKRKAKLNNKHAKKVLPLRTNSHLTLASILLSNVAINAAIALYLNQYLSGFFAGVISTLLIVSFGEILPQALFSRYALKACSYLSWLLRLMIIITYPLSKPTQLLLDRIFGDETIKLHTRRELGVMLSEHLTNDASDLDEDEAVIMKSTLLLSKKRVRDIMTPIKNVFWLSLDTKIDSKKINMIKSKRWSRMPIFNNKKTKCYGILLMKDLVNINFAVNPSLVRDLPLHETKTIGTMTALDTLFRTFIVARTHLMPVTKDSKIVGIVTIEDLIEEILGHEINDESDHIKQKTNNQVKH